MKRERYDIHLGCGSAILYFFMGLCALVIVVGFILFLLIYLIFYG